MKLLDYMGLPSAAGGRAVSKTTSARKADCVAALTAYLGGADCDLRQAVQPGFLYGFGRFLCGDYERHYAPVTAAECMLTLRTYLRRAIAEGHVANLDVMPAVLDRLSREGWGCGAPQRPAKGWADTSQQLGVADDVRRLARSIDAVMVRNRMGGGGATERERRDAVLDAKSAALYLFGMLTYGLEIRDVLSLRRDGADPERVHVGRYGLTLPLPRAARKLAETVNGGRHGGPHLFGTLDNQKYGGDLDKATALMERRVRRFLLRECPRLYRQGSVFTDWLNLALEGGLEADTAATLLRLSAGEEAGPDAADALLEARRLCAGASPGLEESWRLMRVISPVVKRSRFVAMLEGSGILGSPAEARRRIYAPDEWQTDRERGEQAVMSRYVFFRATPMQTEMANSFTPYARVLRESAKGTFMKISEREIRALQEMLHDFPDAVELTDRDEWLRRQNAEIVVGCKAVIRSGSLIGKEATIVQIKGGGTGQPTYLIEYAQGALVFKTSLTGIDLELVRE